MDWKQDPPGRSDAFRRIQEDPGQRADEPKVVRLFRRIRTQSQSPAERPVPMGSEIVRLFRQRNFGYALAGKPPVRPELFANAMTFDGRFADGQNICEIDGQFAADERIFCRAG